MTCYIAVQGEPWCQRLHRPGGPLASKCEHETSEGAEADLVDIREALKESVPLGSVQIIEGPCTSYRQLCKEQPR